MYDIIIIGAGASGLTAARELSKKGKKVLILEARNRLGGRINTITSRGFSKPIEGGAEFVHGNLPLTLQLLKEAKIEYVPALGEIWQEKNGTIRQQEEFIENGEVLVQQLQALEEDIPVKDFLDEHFPGAEYAALRKDIRRFVEGYDAADISRASTVALASEFVADEEQHRVKGGYIQLVQYLEQECKKNGCTFLLNKPVQEVQWAEANITVIAKDGSSYQGKQLVVTVPVGILQAKDRKGISFTPALPDKMKAADAIGFGAVIKLSLEFRTPFWTDAVKEKDLSNMGFLFSEATIPTWWTQAPQQSNLLTGWLAGPAAKDLCYACDEELLKNGLHALAAIFKMDELQLRNELKAWHVANWANDAYSLGAYSYVTVDGQEARKQLAEPVANTIFFAGEGAYVGPDTGTVEAALYSGNEVCRRILQAGYVQASQNR